MAVTVDATKGAYIIPALAGSGYVPLGGGTMTGALTIASGTLTASAPALNITQTWNAPGVLMNALNINVTNTSSNAGSALQTWQVGGVTKLYVELSGGLSAPGGNFYTTGAALITGSGARVGKANSFQFSSDVFSYGTPDLYLFRDEAATLAQRNGTAAQTLRVYRSFTDTSNYSRFTHSWNTSTALLMAEGLGTGTDGNIAFNDAALATGATLGYIMVPSAAGVSTGVPADIPTGQTPIVFDSTNKKIGAYTGGAWVWTAALT